MRPFSVESAEQGIGDVPNKQDLYSVHRTLYINPLLADSRTNT